MDRKTQITIGIILVILTIIGLGYWYFLSIPSEKEIKSAVKKIESVDKNILSDKTVKKILQMNINGDLPINVDESSLGKENPF